jgi:hypothetical protein
MEERNLTLEITENNWKNWVEFLLEILPVTQEFKIKILNRIGRSDDETVRKYL